MPQDCTELTREGSLAVTGSTSVPDEILENKGRERGREEKKKRRKEYHEHHGKSPETLFLGVNLASCDPLSAGLAGSQPGALEPPWPFCLEPGNLSGAQGLGD